MISRACLIGAYQTKLEALASLPDIDLTVVVPAYWREGDRIVRLEQAYVEGYQLIVAPVALNGRFHLHYFPTMASLLADVRPDLLHMDEEPYNLATYLAVRAARAAGVKTLFFSWQNIDRRYPWPFRTLERWVYAAADGAIAGTDGAAAVLRRKGFAGPLRVIPQFGVDPNLFAPREAPERPFTVGFAGRMVPEKGLDTLLEAITGLEGEWRLMLCGTGPLLHQIERTVVANGILDRVAFCEHVPSAEMPARYAEMDALVLPSRTRRNWKEQFGRVLIEAMACGVPVVGADSGAIPGVVGAAGLVFPEGDPTALREHLRALRADPERRRALGASGRERVLARYTQAHVAAVTADVYRALCGAAAAREGGGAA